MNQLGIRLSEVNSVIYLLVVDYSILHKLSFFSIAVKMRTEWPFSRLIFLICITVKFSMYARQFRAKTTK